MKTTHDKIAEKAYYNYLNNGSQNGNDLNDWLEAEKELNTATKPKKTRKRATTKKTKKK